MNDLRRHGLAVDGGRTRGGEETRLLTKDGLAAAAIDLDREIEEMGGMPKSAGRSGASHPMTVNEMVIALIRPKPNLNKVKREPAEAQAAARAAACEPDGIGTLASYATEVALPVEGTWKNPTIGRARADVVLTAPQAGLPLLFIEVDNCTEEAVLIAAKFDKYARFFQRQDKDTDGIEKPLWRTRWSAPAANEYERVHPPVLLVFHQVGQRSAKNQMARVADLTRHHWQGIWHREGGYHSYDRCIPIVATTLDQLREHGPAGPAFWRIGRDHRQPLLDALGNARRDAYLTRRQAAREEQRRCEEREAAQREARRPVCADCGRKFTDDRWGAIGYTPRLGRARVAPALVRGLPGPHSRSRAAGRSRRTGAPGAGAPASGGRGTRSRAEDQGLVLALPRLTGAWTCRSEQNCCTDRDTALPPIPVESGAADADFSRGPQVQVKWPCLGRLPAQGAGEGPGSPGGGKQREGRGEAAHRDQRDGDAEDDGADEEEAVEADAWQGLE
ncbi:replication-relaxation family protein [Streptomyces olivaceus]|uniref:replication-relaxation family protein n=1 Tax=Streptomyces olivaceus TaxID=47716 RepID=UPI0040574C6D